MLINTNNYIEKIFTGAIIVLFFSSVPASYAGQDSKTSMYDALARGYSAVTKSDKALANGCFEQACKFARKARNWQGCIDSGYGLLALNETNAAQDCFDQAFAFAKTDKDWQGCIASGYGYNGLPIILNKKRDAIFAFQQAAQFSKKDGDWRGLTEAGKALFSLGQRSKAINYYNNAFSIAKKIGSSEGLNKLADCYQESADFDKAKECLRLTKIESSAAPPPGWQPAGETVADPPKISPEIQKASRASADKEITQKTKWLIEQKESETQKSEQAKIYVNYYRPYVNYYRWQPFYGSWTVNWASYCLRNYYFRNNIWYWVH